MSGKEYHEIYQKSLKEQINLLYGQKRPQGCSGAKKCKIDN
jgi:hypothetical protein